MPVIAEVRKISKAEAVQLIREHMQTLPPAPEPEFKPGDPVLLDTGDIGVVSGADDDGRVSVFYLDAEGRIKGPSYGWHLTALRL